MTALAEASVVPGPVEPGPVGFTGRVLVRDLARALRVVAVVVDAKLLPPVTGAVVLAAAASPRLGGVVVSASDGQAWASSWVPAQPDLEVRSRPPSGRVVVDHWLLSRVVRAAAGHETVTFVTDGPMGEYLLVTAGPHRWWLPVVERPPDEVWAPASAEVPASGVVLSPDQVRSLASVARAAGTEFPRVLTMVRLSAHSAGDDREVVTATATDRYRMHDATVVGSSSNPSGSGVQPWGAPVVLVPAARLLQVAKLFGARSSKTPVTVSVTPSGGVAVDCGPDQLRLPPEGHAGDYPRVDMLWPADLTRHVVVSSSNLLSAVSALGAVGVGMSPVVLTWHVSLLGAASLVASNQSGDDHLDSARSTSRMPASAEDGQPWDSVAIRPEYLQDAVRHVNADMVSLSITAPGKPLVVSAAVEPALPVPPGAAVTPDEVTRPGRRALVMPVRLASSSPQETSS